MGDGGLISKTEATVQDYKIAAYQEQVEQEVRAEIISEQAIGKEIGIEEIAKKLGDETTWIKGAVANVKKETTNDDIIVTTVDGYIYQVYYNDMYGVVYVEYVGKEGKGNLPELKASYEKSIASILATAKVEGTDIAKLQGRNSRRKDKTSTRRRNKNRSRRDRNRMVHSKSNNNRRTNEI